MLIYFDIVAGDERVRDTEGAVFADLKTAYTEALQCARDQAAELLRCGKAFPAEWRVEVVDCEGDLQCVVSFADLISQAAKTPLAIYEVAELAPRAHHFELIPNYYRSRLLSEETRAIAAELKATCNDIFQNLATIIK